ncbi:hypothetical protein GCM10011516_35470 [Sphingobacterium cellulitidis]|uniref:Uncharacterized protein n=1 Tax=Sphingobacterium cellulitidis TaxID=1768011 RepID=A0A8H9G1Y3_9SPHI|nr:hypothetical protein GCM10011516_35470 [Sphingobacterium soli]
MTLPEIKDWANEKLTVKLKTKINAQHELKKGTLLIIKPELYKDTICCESSNYLTKKVSRLYCLIMIFMLFFFNPI